jgi:hypothetical protein
MPIVFNDLKRNLRAFLRPVPGEVLESMAVDGYRRRVLDYGFRVAVNETDKERDGAGDAGTSPLHH